MKIHIVPWAKYEKGQMTEANGFSVHKSAQDAAEYVMRETQNPSFSSRRINYSAPDVSKTGGFEIITIDILPTNPIAQSLNTLHDEEKGMRVFKSFDGYREMMDLIIKEKHKQKQPPRTAKPKRRPPGM